VARQSREKVRRKHRSPQKRKSRRKLPLDPDADRWLTPIAIRKIAARDAYARKGHRASDDPVFGISIDQYLQLVDWTGRQIRNDKRGAIPRELAPILERLNVDLDEWTDAVEHFGRWTRRIVGTAAEMAAAAQRAGRQWFQGITRCREIFRDQPPAADE
jgi:hypothetical protein